MPLIELKTPSTDNEDVLPIPTITVVPEPDWRVKEFMELSYYFALAMEYTREIDFTWRLEVLPYVGAINHINVVLADLKKRNSESFVEEKILRVQFKVNVKEVEDRQAEIREFAERNKATYVEVDKLTRDVKAIGVSTRTLMNNSLIVWPVSARTNLELQINAMRNASATAKRLGDEMKVKAGVINDAHKVLQAEWREFLDIKAPLPEQSLLY